MSPDDVPASQVLLVTMMPDDSGSIRFGGNAQRVRDGHNLILEVLSRSKQKEDILAHTRYLNGHVLYWVAGEDPRVPRHRAVRRRRLRLIAGADGLYVVGAHEIWKLTLSRAA